MFSENFKNRLIKDFKLPIRILEEPYFSYYLELYRKEFDIDYKIEVLAKSIELAGGEDELMNQWYKVKDQAILSIQQIPEFSKFLRFESEYKLKTKVFTKNVYNKEFLDKTCVSIDIKTANYSALKNFDSNLVLDSNDYKEFIQNFSNISLFQESKIFRQLLFESLAPNKISEHQKDIIKQTLDLIHPEINPIEARMVNSDEIILVFNKTNNLESIENSVSEVVQNTPYSSILKVEAFNLEILYKDSIKKITKNGFLLKNSPVHLYPQLFKKAKGLKVDLDLDLAFIDSETGLLSNYLKPIF